MADTRQASSNSGNRIALGILLTVVSLFCFLSEVGALGGVGRMVYSFMVGFFGLAAYAYSVMGVIAGIAMIFNVRPKMRPMKALLFFGMLAVGIFALHVYTSSGHIVGASYGGYLSACYKNTNTAGGMLFGVLAFPLMKILTSVGALAVACLAFLALAIVALIPSIKKSVTYTATSGDERGSLSPRPEKRERKHISFPSLFEKRKSDNSERLDAAGYAAITDFSSPGAQQLYVGGAPLKSKIRRNRNYGADGYEPLSFDPLYPNKNGMMEDYTRTSSTSQSGGYRDSAPFGSAYGDRSPFNNNLFGQSDRGARDNNSFDVAPSRDAVSRAILFGNGVTDYNLKAMNAAKYDNGSVAGSRARRDELMGRLGSDGDSAVESFREKYRGDEIFPNQNRMQPQQQDMPSGSPTYAQLREQAMQTYDRQNGSTSSAVYTQNQGNKNDRPTRGVAKPGRPLPKADGVNPTVQCAEKAVNNGEVNVGMMGAFNRANGDKEERPAPVRKTNDGELESDAYKNPILTRPEHAGKWSIDQLAKSGGAGQQKKPGADDPRFSSGNPLFANAQKSPRAGGSAPKPNIGSYEGQKIVPQQQGGAQNSVLSGGGQSVNAGMRPSGNDVKQADLRQQGGASDSGKGPFANDAKKPLNMKSDGMNSSSDPAKRPISNPYPDPAKNSYSGDAKKPTSDPYANIAKPLGAKATDSNSSAKKPISDLDSGKRPSSDPYANAGKVLGGNSRPYSPDGDLPIGDAPVEPLPVQREVRAGSMSRTEIQQATDIAGDSNREEAEMKARIENIKKNMQSGMQSSQPQGSDSLREQKVIAAKGRGLGGEKPAKKPERVTQYTIQDAISREEKKEAPKVKKPYVAPPIDLLLPPERNVDQDEDYELNKESIVKTLDFFSVKSEVTDVIVGPTFSMYKLNVEMPRGKSISAITAYDHDISMRLAVSNVRIIAPIPGENAVGIEVPNRVRRTVRLSEVINSPEFNNAPEPATFALGVDLYGNSRFMEIRKLPHGLIAGATGAGKSCCINSLIVSLLYKASPDDVRLILIDPKMTELPVFQGIPHLLMDEIICEAGKAVRALDWAVKEMMRRNQYFKDTGYKDIDEHNHDCPHSGRDKLPRIIIIMDEFADIMTTSRKLVETAVQRLAALGRAAGITLILATQRPSADVISGTIKNNLPTRIAFKVTSFDDSRTLLGYGGCEKLLGNGDLLLKTATKSDFDRIQGAFITNNEVKKVVDFIKTHNESYFDESIKDEIFTEPKDDKTSADSSSGGKKSKSEIADDVIQALELGLQLAATDRPAISISNIQRRLGFGWPRAAKVFDTMQSYGYLTPLDPNSKSFKVNITAEELENLKNGGGDDDDDDE